MQRVDSVHELLGAHGGRQVAKPPVEVVPGRELAASRVRKHLHCRVVACAAARLVRGRVGRQRHLVDAHVRVEARGLQVGRAPVDLEHDVVPSQVVQVAAQHGLRKIKSQAENCA